MLLVSEEWKQAFPGAGVGMMTLSGVVNPDCCAALEQRKRAVEEEIRTRFPNRQAVAEFAPVQAYNAYYKQFGQTYHVQHQLESVGFKGKALPAVAALVEAMFMAELKNGLLTAGHDWQRLRQPLTLQVATGEENYDLINGKTQKTKTGDMLIADADGVLSSIVHGPDYRTRITADTSQALFVVYAPVGISRIAVEKHFDDIFSFVRLIAPAAKLERRDFYGN